MELFKQSLSLKCVHKKLRFVKEKQLIVISSGFILRILFCLGIMLISKLN